MELNFSSQGKVGERFSTDAGQSPNHSLELAQITQLVQIALAISYLIAELTPAVKEETNGNQKT